MIRSIQRLAPHAPIVKVGSSSSELHFAEPPKYTLAQLRSFPRLEPKSFIPLPTNFFHTEIPTRRDILWSATVFEADRARVGSNYVTKKSDAPFSNRKVRPQKGSGRARLGDANSPHMFNDVKAHAIKGPHDWSTEIPKKVYARAIQVALTTRYRDGHMFVIEDQCDFKQDNLEITQSFVSAHKFNNLSMLFIVDSDRDNLAKSMQTFFLSPGRLRLIHPFERRKAKSLVKGKVIKKEDVEAGDILVANRVFVEKSALEWLIAKYAI
ncbi:yml6 [Candida oxycetoniae]|uniref:Large ribosomal subunit protein uL4m n=1 Tax=Candida oxycetoniae TaxID=497107 RepID=A0AAI9WYF9_9ASCO|nr:yml6 [Candida oxycetoniae]KAI3404786.1 yml6 [Candida oxycetoniae]